MGDMTVEERKNWMERVFYQGLKNANRPAKLIYRAPLSANLSSGGSTSKSTEQITRSSLEKMDFESPIWVEFKFNWSHGHSSPKLSIVHGGELTDTYWNPLPKNYKVVWTTRNEDFFVLRWGDPEFVKSFIKYNSQPYVGGTILGSECFIPAKDYISKEGSQKTWEYLFEKQWLFYKVWGRLLYFPYESDHFLTREFTNRYNVDGKKLLKAWSLASQTPLELATLFRGTWDATIYSEGFSTYKQGGGGKFIDINTFINRVPLDSEYVNIKTFVWNPEKIDEKTTTPLMVAARLKSNNKNITRIVNGLRKENISPTLDSELTDIESWSVLSKYISLKIEAGIELETYRKTGHKENKENAVFLLQNALAEWKLLCEKVEKYNITNMPYVFDDNFSWRQHIPEAERDILIAQNSVKE